ncbi:MAG: hypothetical protein GY714_23530 [Desulfobacterales bacterium]|nr:hypothetical protein [Desulfobacterales bacterium]
MKNNKVDKIHCFYGSVNIHKTENKPLALRNFYQASEKSIYHGIGYVPICKDCIKEIFKRYYKNNNNFQLATYCTCQKIDVPYFQSIYEGASKRYHKDDSSQDIGKFYGYYMTVYNSFAGKNGWNYSFDDSETLIEDSKNNISSVIKQDCNISTDRLNQLQDKYGYGYEPEEYVAFEQKYKKITRGYSEKTALHTENLLTYIIHKVKEERCTAAGDVINADKWGKMAREDAKNAKLNVQQLSKSDISGGIDVLAQMFDAVENEAGLIPWLPSLMDKPSDEADLIIWAIVNYMRRLEDKPFVSYKDIWSFYNDMLYEYFDTKGYNKSQQKSFIKEREDLFRDLQDVYIEPVYDDVEFMSEEFDD